MYSGSKPLLGYGVCWYFLCLRRQLTIFRPQLLTYLLRVVATVLVLLSKPCSVSRIWLACAELPCGIWVERLLCCSVPKSVVLRFRPDSYICSLERNPRSWTSLFSQAAPCLLSSSVRCHFLGLPCRVLQPESEGFSYFLLLHPSWNRFISRTKQW